MLSFSPPTCGQRQTNHPRFSVFERQQKQGEKNNTNCATNQQSGLGGGAPGSTQATDPSGRSLSKRRLQSTTGPPVPIRSLDWRLTGRSSRGQQGSQVSHRGWVIKPCFNLPLPCPPSIPYSDVSMSYRLFGLALCRCR